MAFRVLGKEKNLRWDIPVCHSGAVCDKLILAMGFRYCWVRGHVCDLKNTKQGFFFCMVSASPPPWCRPYVCKGIPIDCTPAPQSEHQMARKTLCDRSLPCAGPWGARGTKEKLPRLNNATITDITAVQGKLKAKLPVLMSQPRGMVQMGDLSPPDP